MAFGQLTGLVAMGCWWAGTWLIQLYPEQWPYALGLTAVGGGVLVFGWMLTRGGVTVEKHAGKAT